MPTILGLSGLYHDSAAAITVDGRIVAAVQEERLTRVKGDASFPHRAIDSCLAIAGLSSSSLNAVAFYEYPALKFDRLIETFMAGVPSGFRPFRAAMPSWITSKLRVREQLFRRFADRPNLPIHFCAHHLAHAASAYYPSPFDSAAILTIDGVGEWATASISHGRGNRLEPLVELRFPHSLGLLYSAVTSYCGFEINTGEYKLMGLAAAGQPRFVDSLLRDIVHVTDDGAIELDQRYFDYCHGLRMTSTRFHRTFGRPPRTSDQDLSELDCDLAASVQAITELAMTKMVQHALKLTGERRLCLAGGVALNCVAVGHLSTGNVVDDIWVQPAAGDAGGAVGAALWLSHERLQLERISSLTDSFLGSFLGPSFATQPIETVIKRAGLEYRELPTDNDLATAVASLIAHGAVVGWYQGAMEFGPRALGHRSILADPRDGKMKDKINRLVKHRELFRPFAPAVLRTCVADYFAIPEHRSDFPYMTYTLQVLRPAAIPAVTHIDGTARVQTVDHERNPKFAALLMAFQELTGVPVLLNTSFNDRDEPIVCSPEDAIRCFQATDLDALAIENFLVLKQSNVTGNQTVVGDQFPSDDAASWFSKVFAIQQRVTYPIRWLGSTVALALVFYLLLTPIGLWRRLWGHRALSQVGWLPFTDPTTNDRPTSDDRPLSWQRELLRFLREEKKWWLIPIAVSLAVVAVAASVGGTVAPWIYVLW